MSDITAREADWYMRTRAVEDGPRYAEGADFADILGDLMAYMHTKAREV